MFPAAIKPANNLENNLENNINNKENKSSERGENFDIDA